MGTGTKKSPGGTTLSAGLPDAAAGTLKKLRRVTKQVRRLSTTHKVLGSMALLDAGLAYLVNRPTAAKGAGGDDSTTGGAAAELGESVRHTAVVLAPSEGSGKSKRRKPTGPV